MEYGIIKINFSNIMLYLYKNVDILYKVTLFKINVRSFGGGWGIYAIN
jgi:hypothetical protein